MRRLLTAILIAATALTASAQSSIKVSAPNLVALDEQFSVTFTISGEAPSDFQWEVPSDFRLVWGPQKGSSTSISIVNGKHSRSSQTTYSYVLLPKSTGKFTLPQAFATVKGDRVASKAHSIEVVSNGAKPADPNQGGAAPNVQSRGQAADPQSNAARTGTVGGDDLFLRLSLSKTSAVVGETLTATLKLYQRVNISGFEDIKFPAFNGFWSQELQSPTSIEFRRESVGDIIYNAASGAILINGAQKAANANIRALASRQYSILVSACRYGAAIQYYGAWRYEDFVISNKVSGALLCDLRPCYRKADGVVGFWDDVSKTFLTSQGTGTVIAGPDLS